MPSHKETLKTDGRVLSGTPVRATASGVTIVGGSAGGAVVFTFPYDVSVARIVKRSSCTADLLVSINREDVDEDDWNENIGSDERRLTINHVPVRCLTIMADVDVTVDTEIAVDGWR